MKFYIDRLLGALKVSLIKSILWFISIFLLGRIVLNLNAFTGEVNSEDYEFWFLPLIFYFTLWYMPMSILRAFTSINFLKYILVIFLYYGFFFAFGQLLAYGTLQHVEFVDPLPFYLYLTLFWVEFIYKLFEDIASTKEPPIDTRNARMLLLSAFYRGLAIYFIVIIVWPYIFRPDLVSSLVDLSNPSLVITLFANIKTLLIFFLLSIPTVFTSKFISTYLVRKNKIIYENILVLSSIVVYVTILNIIISSFFSTYASKELFRHFYLLTTFTELFFIHFINQNMNNKIQ